MSLPGLAVRRPVATLMLLVSILVVGGLSVLRLPLEFYPRLNIPAVWVQVLYPNSNPAQTDRTVARPLEEVLATLPDLKKIRSNSAPDHCWIELSFDWGLDLDVLRVLVREKVDQVRPALPRDVADIRIFSFTTSDIPVIQGRISAPGVDLSRNYELLETRVVNRIRRVPGVARVDLGGVLPRSVFIDLKLDAILAHSVDVGKLLQRLRSLNSSLTVGRVTENGLRYTARAIGSMENLEQLRNLAVDDRGVRLADVAEIRYEEPPIGHARHLNREKAVALEVFKESTANTVATVEAVRRVIADEISADPLLKGINLFVWEDQAREIRSGIEGLRNSGLIGGLLAVLVLYFFLRRWDSTFIVAASVPISLLSTTAVMYFAGRNLNVMAMMGLMLGVGMLVDNAIVVLESIDRRHRQGGDRKVSAERGAAEVAMAISASTLTSVIVFLPLVVGDKNDITIFLGEAGFAISVALLSSLVVSLLMIPLMAGRLLGRRAKAAATPGMGWLEGRYVRVLAWTFRHKASTFAIVALCFGLGVVPLAAGWVETSTFSGSVNRRLFLSYEFFDFAYKSDVKRAVDQVEALLFERKDEFQVRDVYSYYEENRAQSTIILRDESLDDKQIKELRGRIRDALPEMPGVRAYFREQADEGGSMTYFTVKLFGNDLDTLNHWGRVAADRLDEVEAVEDVLRPGRNSRREVQVRLDPDRARKLGLDPRAMADVLAFSLGGLRLPRFNAGDREADVQLALRLQDRQNLSQLRLLPVRSAAGRPVTLGDVADFQVVPRPQTIQRENRQIRVAIRAAFEGKQFGPTKEKISKMMDGLGLPAGVSWSWNDRIEEQGEQGQQMVLNLLLALTLVYVLMSSLFESATQPLAILFAIPFSLVGASWFLLATGTPFNLMANMGMLILIGIVVNNGIVLLDRVNHYRALGRSREDAALEAGRDRLRPILMTAATTVLGLLPLALGRAGVGGWAYYYPLARTVMGGLISSTFLTLIVLPYVNDRVESLADWARRVWARSGPRPTAAPETAL